MKETEEAMRFVESLMDDSKRVPYNKYIGWTLKEVLEKQIPKRAYEDKSDERTLHKCPTCKYIFVTEYHPFGELCAGRKSRYCPECGQAMQW